LRGLLGAKRGVAVRSDTRQAEVSGSLLEVLDERCQLAVRLLSARSRCRGVHRGCEERVDELDSAVGTGHAHQRRLFRRPKRFGVDERQVRSCGRSRSQKSILCPPWEGSHTPRDEAEDVSRDRYGVGGNGCGADHPRNLQRVQRVAARGLRNPNEHRPRKDAVETVGQNAMQRRQGDGAELDPLEPLPRQPGHERVGFLLRAHRDDQPHRLVVQSPQREFERR